jgi:hypothetical protein
MKDRSEEMLFERRRDLFSGLEVQGRDPRDLILAQLHPHLTSSPVKGEERVSNA